MTETNDGYEITDGEVTINDPKAVLSALDRAKKDAKKYREERDAALASVEDATKAGEGKYKSRVVQAEAKLELQRLGVKDVDRLLTFINSDSVDLDADGKLVGLSDQIESLKNTLPEVFDAKRRVGGNADIFEGNDTEPQTETATDLLLKQLMGT